MSNNIFFNAQHSPIGAFASFTLGFRGKKGGLGLELGKPADQNIYIGMQSKDGQSYEALPFFEGVEDESARYDVEKKEEMGKDEVSDSDNERVDGGYLAPNPIITTFQEKDISREFKTGVDTWQAGDMTFSIYSPVRSVPEPGTLDTELMKAAIVPAVFAEFTLDNTDGRISRKAFFGYEGSDPYSAMRLIHGDGQGQLTGVGQGRMTAIVSNDPGIIAVQGFTIDKVLSEPLASNRAFGLGNTAALLMEVPAGEKRTFKFAVCFYRGGIVTTGIDASYYYTRYFSNIEEVAKYSLENFSELTTSCESANAIDSSSLSKDQAFMLDHAIHSYYGSTQFLDAAGEPIWVVNEGEYRMMNTLDLTADQLFFELMMNPWTVRNELELFVSNYSYEDHVNFPGDRRDYPGGLTFTHDMGIANAFSRPQYSAYEMAGLHGCFSYMSHEELVNWLCCALVYIDQTQDKEFKDKMLPVIRECFQSMLNRDHPEREKRNGIMGLDSSRTEGGTEITTYDSLDVSLGQSRNNIYMAGKCWAIYVALEQLFALEDLSHLSKEAGEQADKCAASVAEKLTEQGYIPAVIDENNDSKIISAIEGLVFPYFMGCEEALDINGRYSQYLKALQTHLRMVLVKGTCLFDNGAWKLSSTSNNSWLSKIYLAQFISREIMDLPWDESGAVADAAHVEWLLHPELSYWCWSDQILNGLIEGSKYYPRGVTAILWLFEGKGSRLVQ